MPAHMQQYTQARTSCRLRSSAAPAPAPTALIMLSKKGETEKVRALLAVGANPDLEALQYDDDEDGVYDIDDPPHAWKPDVTPLIAAAEAGHADVVAALLRSRANPTAATVENGVCPLYMAAQEEHLAVARLLLAHSADVNQQCTDDGATPLLAAVINRSGVGMFDANNNNNNNNNNNGVDPATATTPPAAAAATMLSLLLDAGANPRLGVGEECVHPLWKAADLGDRVSVAVLLKHGADPNQATADTGATPLYAAAVAPEADESSGSGCIRALLYHGADPNLATVETQVTPLSRAATYGSPLKTLQMLAVFGASTTQPDLTGVTPLGYATTEQNADAVRWLQAVEGWSPLRVAVAAFMPEAAAVALRLGAVDPDAFAGGGGGGGGSVQELLAVRALATLLTSSSGASRSVAPPPSHFEVHQVNFEVHQVNRSLVSAGKARGVGPQRRRATASLARAASIGWAPPTHWLHHSSFRRSVFTVLLTSERLRRAAYHPDHPDAGSTAPPPPPLLPAELWLVILGFCLRSWWKPPSSVGSTLAIPAQWRCGFAPDEDAKEATIATI